MLDKNYGQWDQCFRDAFAKLRKATLSFIVFARPNGETQFLLKNFREI
jgi:hypothetical protein